MKALTEALKKLHRGPAAQRLSLPEAMKLRRLLRSPTDAENVKATIRYYGKDLK